MHETVLEPGPRLVTAYRAEPASLSEMVTVPEAIEFPVLSVVAVNAAKTPSPATALVAPTTSVVSRSLRERGMDPSGFSWKGGGRPPNWAVHLVFSSGFPRMA